MKGFEPLVFNRRGHFEIFARSRVLCSEIRDIYVNVAGIYYYA